MKTGLIRCAADCFANHRDKLIKDAISHVIGRDDWSIKEIDGRGKFIQSLDGTERFVFDGLELIQFYSLRSEIDHSYLGCHINFKQTYQLLYDSK